MVDKVSCLVNRIFKILSFGLGRVIAAQPLTSSPMNFGGSILKLCPNVDEMLEFTLRIISLLLHQS